MNMTPISHQDTLRNIYVSIRPMYEICRIIGLNSIRIKKNGQFNVEKWFPSSYFGAYLILYIILNIYTLVCITTVDGNFAIVNKYIMFAQSCVMTTLMLIAVIFTFSFRQVQIKALDLLSHIDVCFVRNGFVLEYKKLLKMNYIISSVATVSLIVRSFLTLITARDDIIQQATLLLATAIKSFSKYQCVVFVLQLHMRFVEINKAIKSLYRKRPRTNRLVLNPARKTTPEQLYVLCRLHYKLTSVMQKINSVFAVQLLASIAVSLFDVLFQSYFLYYAATGKTVVFSVFMIICPTVWLIDETIEIYWLVHACANTCDQANETVTILHELRNHYFDMDLESQIQTYSLQMLHQKTQFSVLGFFVVDYTLIYSIVGAVTTYLVIFIQFDQSSNSSDGSDFLKNKTVNTQV